MKPLRQIFQRQNNPVYSEAERSASELKKRSPLQKGESDVYDRNRYWHDQL